MKPFLIIDPTIKSQSFYSWRKTYFKHFFGTLFIKDKNQIINDEQKQQFSKLFFFLPSISDRKEGLNQYMDNVSLHPVGKF